MSDAVEITIPRHRVGWGEPADGRRRPVLAVGLLPLDDHELVRVVITEEEQQRDGTSAIVAPPPEGATSTQRSPSPKGTSATSEKPSVFV